MERSYRPGGALKPEKPAPRATTCHLVCLLGLIAAAPAANALDLDDTEALVTETIASRERQRDYDNAKQYGAERVSDRIRKHVQPIGVRAGNYLIFPSVFNEVIFDDNIFGAATAATSDWRNELSPSLVLQSHLPRHILDFAFGGRLVSYAENTDQDYADANASLRGALHIDHAHTLAITALTNLSHEERSDLTASRGAAEPVEVWRHRVAVGLTRDVGRLFGTVSGSYERKDFSDVDDLDGSRLDQDVRDIAVWNAQLRNGYRFSPGFEVVSKLRFLRINNPTLNLSAAENFEGYGYEALAGFAFQTSPLLRWRILGGYGFRDFDEVSRGDVGTTLIEGHFEWLPTQRMTILGAVSREFVDLQSIESGGRVETKANLKIDYEVYNNLILTLGGSIQDADFIEDSRNDRTYSARIGIEYYLNKNWLFTFGYEHQTRDSTSQAFDMSRNRVMVGAKLRF